MPSFGRVVVIIIYLCIYLHGLCQWLGLRNGPITKARLQGQPLACSKGKSRDGLALLFMCKQCVAPRTYVPHATSKPTFGTKCSSGHLSSKYGQTAWLLFLVTKYTSMTPRSFPSRWESWYNSFMCLSRCHLDQLTNQIVFFGLGCAPATSPV